MISEQVRQSPVFASLGDAELDEICRRGTRRRFPAGERILEGGVAGGALHVVVTGRVRISKLVPAGGEEALAILDPGQFFGEIEFLDGGPPVSGGGGPHRLRDAG